MVIVPYINKKTQNLYFRVKLNTKDFKRIKSDSMLFYKLKCIGATENFFDINEQIKTENLDFCDRLFPRVPRNEVIRKKAVFQILLLLKQKKNHNMIIVIEFYKKNHFVFRDAFMLDKVGSVQDANKLTRSEYLLGLELEKIYEILFDITGKSELCKNCEYFPGYQADGYCLNYHPDSGIPAARF